ncbi:hypothetical protein TetV_170 [Tetraselmis virus 1]|uniref:Uncharacterized protein n=1 Tax=Tetraselmis virus 1 TaxID=2060617 RepID=A0A2P0VMY2_9VIRU|nr:hypothetical protein QJ968_gp170 [Tetraselmis virus 1]AUF82262.1 hypothetical protein TetV_170 [Tetraselmis virus 1]
MSIDPTVTFAASAVILAGSFVSMLFVGLIPTPEAQLSYDEEDNKQNSVKPIVNPVQQLPVATFSKDALETIKKIDEANDKEAANELKYFKEQEKKEQELKLKVKEIREQNRRDERNYRNSYVNPYGFYPAPQYQTRYPDDDDLLGGNNTSHNLLLLSVGVFTTLFSSMLPRV